MDNERLTKKLALFYHPLFQNTIIEWILSFNVNQSLMDVMSFIEINLRIQKIILPEFSFTSSLPSAATDWVREIEVLSPGVATSQQSRNKNNQYNEIHKLVNEMAQDIPFELACSPDKYVAFFANSPQQNLSNYLNDKISFSAFAKFLFDLCCSWCEHYDIEIFVFFLLGVLYQAAVFQSSNLLTTRSFEQIHYLSEAFVTKIKWLKLNYKKKEYENFSYDNWYSYNYEPTRLLEIKHKCIESLMALYKEHESIESHISELFEGSISQIVREDLSKPTKSHFDFLFKEENILKAHNTNNLMDLDHNRKLGITERATNQMQMRANAYTKMPKKTTIPIFGKALMKTQPAFPLRSHTISSVDAFKDENDETINKNLTSSMGESPLCPIWEQDVSDAGTEITSREINSQEKLWVQKDEDVPKGHKKKTLEASYGSLLNSNKRFGSLKEPKKMLESLENSFIWDYELNKEKVQLNRRELIAKSIQLKDEFAGDDESMRIDNKINLILEDGNNTQKDEEEKLISQAHRKKIMANANLFDTLLSDIHKGAKTLSTSNDNNNLKKQVTETKREELSINAGNKKEKLRGYSQESSHRKWKPYGKNQEEVEHYDENSRIKELEDTRMSISNTMRDKNKINQTFHLPRLSQNRAEEKIKSQGYSQNLAQGYGASAIKNRKQMVVQNGKKDLKSKSFIKEEVQNNKSLKTDPKAKRRTQQAMLDQWYYQIFDKMRKKHEDNRRNQDIRMRSLKKPEEHQKGRAGEGKYITKIGVEEILVTDLKESGR